MTVFDHRDAFADTATTASQLRYQTGPRCDRPGVSIVIPTFRRIGLLLETLASALGQVADIAFEVVIVDNDPDPAANAETIARLPKQPGAALRYFVNGANIGMFPNWNRGIELARGEWVTVLNDDDVLHPDFLIETLRRIRARPAIDGLVCRTGYLDRRPVDVRPAPPRSPARSLWRRIAKARFDRDGLARVHPRQLFFGNSLSNTLGFLFRRQVMLALGGFRPEDSPSADYLLYARFAGEHGLFLLDRVLADVGVGENESLRVETMTGFMVQGERLRRAMAGRYVPRRWLRMGPLIVATAVAETNGFWHGRLDPAVIGRELGMALPAASRVKLNLLRLFHRAI